MEEREPASSRRLRAFASSTLRSELVRPSRLLRLPTSDRATISIRSSSDPVEEAATATGLARSGLGRSSTNARTRASERLLPSMAETESIEGRSERGVWSGNSRADGEGNWRGNEAIEEGEGGGGGADVESLN